MKTNTIKIGKTKINVPADYQKVQSMENDPPNSFPLMLQTEQAMCFVLIYPISKDQAMPFEFPQHVIDGIHKSMNEQQGLIEVEACTSNSGNKAIYSVVKTVREEGGVTYTWTFHIEFPNEVIAFQGFFEEIGITGIRDNTIFEFAIRKSLVEIKGDTVTGWNNDPYDETYKYGQLKNLSEDRCFDPMFPMHPLSMLNMFKQIVIDSN